ncbi:MAG TPA: penicillin-binding transpeptidase domain-containing protein, partial [bacterium]|nr:penicillin-binding transpeptidase domain-containing protein [bacterium]
IVTVGIALINKVMSLKDTLWGENGKFVVVSGRKPIIIKESKNHDYGFMDLKKLISVSSNIGSAKLSLMIGKDRFEKGINKFGFGKRTEIDLPGEVSGLYPKRVGKVELANMGFGQGISVTPMQMVKSYAIIANGGYDVIPHVVDNIKDEKGKTIYEYDYQKEDKVIPTDITKELTSMLKSVVEEGTGTSTNIQGFEIVGKTGTAQKPVRGGYSADKYASSFSGFFPASNPKYAMLVIIDEPKRGSYYGGSVAGPLFRNIANIIVQGTDTKVPLSDKKEEKKKPVEEEEYKEQTSSEKDMVVEKGTVPDLKGRSLRNALKMISTDFKEVKVSGNGRVVRQEPQAGPKPEGLDTMNLWLE